MGFSFSDFMSDLTSQFSTSVGPTQSAKNAGTAGKNARDAASTKNTTLSQNFHGDYTPEVVSTAMENFEGMSHDRIIQYRNSVVPTDMNSSVAAWETLADITNKKAESFRTDIEKLINNGWSGASAESAKTSVRKYADDVHSLQNAANMVANKLSDASATLTQVKAQIPDKAKRKSTSIAGIVTDVVAGPVGIATLGGQLMADHGRASNTQAEARAVMQQVYAKYLPEADKGVPKMPGVTTADNSGGASGPSNPASTAQSYSPTYNSNASSYGPSSSSGASTSSGTSTNPSSYNSGSTAYSSSLNLPDATTGNSSGATSMNSLNNTSTAGYSPSGSGTAGTTGGGGFNSSATGGGLGSSIPGTNSGTNSAATAANAANAAKSTNGLNSMMPHGQSKKEGDDAEHKSADYLRGIQEELLGPEQKFLPGGVIGGEYGDE
ncbi:PPE domain-containing protein [Nocardia macrotermitis]|uniref:PPE domain-containing protein n=1 Tax=Nocardia macrotermitis TaxID=2585198 RepID=A0A7K0DE65_9NOCA|nr:hypothetical protein [Nocardia macrotermitis]MQY23929.1 hypothetical protein [Nocardia macrotermitis]